MNAWDHPLIKKGMPLQLAKRRAHIRRRRAAARLESRPRRARRPCRGSAWQAPVVGFLVQRALLLSGSSGIAQRAGTRRWPSRKSACA